LSKLEEEYSEVTGKYEEKKKDIVGKQQSCNVLVYQSSIAAVKNKQTGMEERISRAKKTLSKMHIPQVDKLVYVIFISNVITHRRS